MCDYTASCYIDVIGDQAEKLIEKKAVEFHAMDPVQQNAHLDKLKYKNVLMKLRTERKPGKGDSHSVYGIEKSTADNTLREIRKKNAQNRLKLEED